MIWNYRLVKSVDTFGEPVVAIHEVYYDENNVEEMCVENPATVSEGSVEEVRVTLEWMLKALTWPVLNLEDFKKVDKIV